MILATLITLFFALADQTIAHPTASLADSDVAKNSAGIGKRQSCDNTATSRSCWGDYSIDTNWYDVTPDTGVTVEYWLSVVNTTLSLDGVERYTLSFNGTIPGPTITANWGDNLKIHVTNNMAENGTAIHWHGLRQKGSLEYDGVPGVTQCPIAPGDTLTYEFQVTQYGSTWYHSHFTLQYADGLYGPLVINGPSTANWDVDLGPILIADWGHTDAFSLWESTLASGGTVTLDNGLINGKNTWNLSTTDIVGSRSEFTFSSGTSYLLRLVNCATDATIRFAIDGHNLTVISTDLVPIVPYVAESIMIGIGQRYEVVVSATQDSGDFWMRAIWQTTCSTNTAGNAGDVLAIVRYDASSTADPTSTSDATTIASQCADEPAASLVPYLALDVTTSTITDNFLLSYDAATLFTWTIDSSALYLNWSDPTILRIENNDTIWPTDYNVKPLTSVDDWVIIVIQNSALAITHPIHLHGHDFWVLAQGTTTFDASTFSPQLTNAPRRDVASLPSGGYLAIAFQSDNPGSWLMHCHIAWHASQGLALQFVERETEVAALIAAPDVFEQTCDNWDAWIPGEVYAQDDSGI